MTDLGNQLQFALDGEAATQAGTFTKASAPIQRRTKWVSVGDGSVEAFLMAGEPVFILGDVRTALGQTGIGLGENMRKQLRHLDHFVFANLEGKGGSAKTVLTYAGLRKFLSISMRNKTPHRNEKPAVALKSLPSADAFVKQLRGTDLGFSVTAYRGVFKAGNQSHAIKKIRSAVKAPCQPIGEIEVWNNTIPSFRKGPVLWFLGNQLFGSFGFCPRNTLNGAKHSKRIRPKNLLSVKLDRVTDGGASAPTTAINIDGVMEFLATSTHPNAPLMRTAMAALKQALSEDPEATLSDLPEFIENGISN